MQDEFFRTTTLPLVEQVLLGQGGLLFSYGVSNSGKTFTIQGTSGNQQERGLIPRSIDVIFNSIEGLHCDKPVSDMFSRLSWYADPFCVQIKIVGQTGIEFAETEEEYLASETARQQPSEKFEEDTSILVCSFRSVRERLTISGYRHSRQSRS